MKLTYMMAALAVTTLAVAPTFAEGMKRSTTTTTDQTSGNATVGGDAIAPAAGGLLTREQATAQFRTKGYTNVSNLTSDSNGTWRGTATVDGKKRNVMIDAQGNISAQ
ncbi:MAG: hypothetical protein DI585_04910 [Pseudomonas fluorescens]|nr:MAG: hypothetical protein DI585_04910 [Pseudomonas fluorescens]